MSNHTQAITQVKWGGDGLIYSAGRDCSINVWAAADGRLLRRCVASAMGSHRAQSLCVVELRVVQSCCTTPECGRGVMLCSLTGHGHWVNTMSLSTGGLCHASVPRICGMSRDQMLLLIFVQTTCYALVLLITQELHQTILVCLLADVRPHCPC
jgi:WD40 repeat protein